MKPVRGGGEAGMQTKRTMHEKIKAKADKRKERGG